MQTAADQDESDVQDKPVVANAPEVSFSTTITRASGSSSQPNQVCNNPERTQVCREMERAGRTAYTFVRIMTETVHSFKRPPRRHHPKKKTTPSKQIDEQIDISVKNLDNHRQIGTKNLASLQTNNVSCMKTTTTIHKGFCDFANSFGTSAVTRSNKVETRRLAFSSS